MLLQFFSELFRMCCILLVLVENGTRCVLVISDLVLEQVKSFSEARPSIVQVVQVRTLLHNIVRNQNSEKLPAPLVFS